MSGVKIILRLCSAKSTPLLLCAIICTFICFSAPHAISSPLVPHEPHAISSPLVPRALHVPPFFSKENLGSVAMKRNVVASLSEKWGKTNFSRIAFAGKSACANDLEEAGDNVSPLNATKKKYKSLDTSLLTTASFKQFHQIKTAAYFAAAAYDNDQSRLRAWKCKKCSFLKMYNVSTTQIHVWSRPVQKSKNETLGFLFMNPKWTVMAFTGIVQGRLQGETFMDLMLKDVDTYSINNTKVKVMESLVEKFNELDSVLKEDWFPKIKAYYADHNPANILFAGHSLGSGLAVLAALRFYDDLAVKTRAQVFLIKAPKFGDSAWVRSVARFPMDTWNVVDVADAVPRTPFYPGNVFRVLSTVVWTRGTSMYICPAQQQAYCSDRLRTRPRFWQLMHSSYYHNRFLDQPWFFGTKSNNPSS